MAPGATVLLVASAAPEMVESEWFPVKFRRKSSEPGDGSSAPEETYDEAADQADQAGPWDADDVPGGIVEGERLDLGSLLLTPVDGMEVRLQVEEATQEVQSVLVAGPESAVELRAFAAPRGGNLWGEIMPRLAADYAQRGGTASPRDGRYGTELHCQLTVRTDDGRTGTQASRVIGINGPRWMLRATLLGRPAVEPDAVGPWDEVIETLVVRRGPQAMPVGAELPITLPREQPSRRDV